MNTYLFIYYSFRGGKPWSLDETGFLRFFYIPRVFSDGASIFAFVKGEIPWIMDDMVYPWRDMLDTYFFLENWLHNCFL